MRRFQAVCAMLLSFVAGLFAMMLLAYAARLLFDWCLTRTTDLYYIDYHFLSAALLAFCLGMVCTGLIALALWRKGPVGVLSSLVSLVIGFYAVASVPDWPEPTTWANGRNHAYFTHAFDSIDDWRMEHQLCPRNEAELDQALRKCEHRSYSEADGSGLDFFSANAKNRARLRFQWIIVPNATGPKLDGVSERPAVIYYCVSADYKRYWITMTDLDSEFDKAAHLRMHDGKPFVLGWFEP